MDRPKARRLLAVAAIFDGATRTEAAKLGVTAQTVRDWVMRFNAHGSLRAGAAHCSRSSRRRGRILQFHAGA